MICNRRELNKYIRNDREKNLGEIGKRGVFILWIIRHERYHMYKYLKNLRYYEYYRNIYEHNSSYLKLLFALPYFYRKIRYYHLTNKYGVCIVPNTVKRGIKIVHYNAGVIINCKHMGENCIVSSGVVVGNKGEKYNVATIGNNVELCVGSKVIGKVIIGDNVIVAPNSVVINDVPANCIVSGVPAKIIKTITHD